MHLSKTACSFRIQAVASHLHNRLSGLLDPAASDAASATKPLWAVMSFIWPGHVNKAAYMRAKGKTEAAGAHLALLVNLLHARGQMVVVLAHSMGCRVALNAVKGLEPPVSRLILLGAALHSDALSTDFNRSTLGADRITVYYSAHDEALSGGFSVGEALSGEVCRVGALGLVGVDTLGGIPDGVESIDLTDQVSGHNPNLWLMSPAVNDALASELGLGAPPELLEGPAGAWAEMDGFESDRDDEPEDSRNGWD